MMAPTMAVAQEMSDLGKRGMIIPATENVLLSVLQSTLGLADRAFCAALTAAIA